MMSAPPATTWIKTALLALAWACLVPAFPAAAQVDDGPLEITDIRLSNYGGNNFVVSWRTTQATADNELLVGLSPGALTIIKADILPAPSRIHYAQVTNADIAFLDTTYFYKVRSDGVEGSVSPAGYDSILTRQQPFATLGASVAGYVVDARSGQALPNIIVRSFLRMRYAIAGGGTRVDSTHWYADLTDASGKYGWSLSNYHTYSGGNIAYVPGNTWMHVEIFGQGEGAIRDSVLLPFPRNDLGEFFQLNNYELEDAIEGAKNGLSALPDLCSPTISALRW